MAEEKTPKLSESTAQWLKAAKERADYLNTELLNQACLFVENTPDQIKPTFAHSSLEQGLAMADTLIDLHCDNQTLAAAIIYPCFHHNQLHQEQIEKFFQPILYKLLIGAQRMEAIHTPPQNNHQQSLQQETLDNLRKMLLAIVDDVRVVLIKLAERLAILKYLKQVNTEVQKQIALQTMAVYAPLANRLGIGQLKWKLEDLSFRYINPEEYAKISKSLKMRRQEREEFVHEMIEKLTHLFQDAQIKNITITGRAKHIYSIYRKMHNKGLAMDEIYDTSAVRILVPTIQDCYTALGIVHAAWTHIAKEFDDYIAKPKPNGYCSIHTAIMGPKNINVEVQIRTHQMHEEAELGVAAHWKYKEGSGAGASTYEEKINWLREVMDWQKEISAENPDAILSNIFEDRVYVFTPKGDVYDLPANSTPLDFAYHIHTEIGHRCRGATVNGAMVPLTHPLKTGDRVSILTAKQGNPSRDWLNPELGYLHTPTARTKVRHWFRKMHYEENLEAGSAIWEKASRRAQLPRHSINEAVKHFNYKTANDLLAGIGVGDISVTTVIHQIQAKTPSETVAEEKLPPIKAPKKTRQSQSDLMIEGVGDLLTTLARCCKPIPGDSILGYITKGRGVSIHQKKCHNIQQALKNRIERVIEVSWGSKHPQSYTVDLAIEADDRHGLIRDITNILTKDHIAILGMNSRADKLKGTAFILLTVEIKSSEPLEKVIAQLLQVEGVAKVVRG